MKLSQLNITQPFRMMEGCFQIVYLFYNLQELVIISDELLGRIVIYLPQLKGFVVD